MTESPDKKPRVLIVDDVPDVARMLEMLVDRDGGMLSVGTLNSARALVKEVRERRADVVVIDRSLPGEDTLGAIRELTREVPACTIIVCSGWDDATTAREVEQAGARQLVSKHGGFDTLLDAIRHAAPSSGGR